MKKYIHIFLCLMIITTGCSKKKNNPKIAPTGKKSSIQKSTFNENLEAFNLDDDALHNFAHDNNPSEQSTDNSSSTIASKSNAIFQWEDVAVDQSKDEFKKIYFAFDKHEIDKSQESALKTDIEHAKKMIALGKTIVIEGHACDSAGSAIYNMTLSEQRAKFIATQFIQADINRSDIKIAARGQEMPIVKGGNRHQQAVNRRVEIFAIDSK